MEKYINILKNTPLFQGISEAEILPMLKCLSVSIKNYSKGEYLLRSVIRKDVFPVYGMRQSMS